MGLPPSSEGSANERVSGRGLAAHKARLAQLNRNCGLLSLADAVLWGWYEANNDHIQYCASNCCIEIQRRTQNRHALAVRRLAAVTTVLAAITALLGVGAFVSQIAGTHELGAWHPTSLLVHEVV